MQPKIDEADRPRQPAPNEELGLALFFFAVALAVGLAWWRGLV